MLKLLLLRRLPLMLAAGLLLLATFSFIAALQEQETTLEIRAASHGAVIPDGFSVWHHLDAHGIRFKSITPQDDILLIKFDSSDQSNAAREVLTRTLPRGFIIAQQEPPPRTNVWFSRLRKGTDQPG